MNGKINHISQVSYIRRYTLNGGTEDGLKVIEIDNGNIRFLLNESKALDIMQLWHQGMNISFISKNGFTKRETPFLNRFEGGMLYTCGLDNIGDRNGYEMHGSLHNCPAEVKQCEIIDNEIIVRAEIRSTALFGANLLLQRIIKTEFLSDKVELCDTLINLGTKEEPYCILYHVNLGYPFLDKDVEINSDTISVLPRNAFADTKMETRAKFSDAMDNAEEFCFFIKHKQPKVLVKNHTIGKEFTLEYSDNTLPCFVQWCSPASSDYALGLEPSTTELDERFAYKQIAPKESIGFYISITVKNQ